MTTITKKDLEEVEKYANSQVLNELYEIHDFIHSSSDYQNNDDKMDGLSYFVIDLITKYEIKNGNY